MTGPARLHSLDALRGIAAIAVVIYHWRSFWHSGFINPEFHEAKFPFYGLFSVVYEWGWLSVDIFFCLSGFIFYWLYSEAVRTRKVEAREFALLRFSRLYPLHFVTLIVCAIALPVHEHVTGTFLGYPFDDVYHFILQLAMASSWGLEFGHSFNNPIWSVSVEVLLYGLFFALSRWLPVRVLVPIAISVLGLDRDPLERLDRPRRAGILHGRGGILRLQTDSGHLSNRGRRHWRGRSNRCAVDRFGATPESIARPAPASDAVHRLGRHGAVPDHCARFRADRSLARSANKSVGCARGLVLFGLSLALPTTGCARHIGRSPRHSA